jgi:hypothetical protein
LLRFQVPKVAEVKAYLVQLPDGKLVVRTEEELAQVPQPQTKK